MLVLGACGEARTTDAGDTSNPALAGEGAAAYSPMAGGPRVSADPQKLLGWSADSILRALGDPTLVRRDGGAEVWQYRTEDCVLDLFLYGESKQVEHVDLRDRAGGGEGVRACFEDMVGATPEEAP